MKKAPNGHYTWQLFLLFILFDLFFGLFFLRGFCRLLFGGLLAVLAFAHDAVSLSLRLCCVSIPDVFHCLNPLSLFKFPSCRGGPLSQIASAGCGCYSGRPSQKNKASTDTGVPAEALAKAGGGGGNRTRVRRSYTEGVYMLIPVFVLAIQSSTGRDIWTSILLNFASGPQALPSTIPLK